MRSKYYETRLYPFQDRVLTVIKETKTSFYLTGGTALSRFYLDHRYSDDLDFFVNYDSSFKKYVNIIVNALKKVGSLEILYAADDFYRVNIVDKRKNIELKLEFVNDVPSHIGTLLLHDLFGNIDSIENIFANKITAILDRGMPKDIGDFWSILKKYNLSLKQALTDADSKAAGIHPTYLAKVISDIDENLLGYPTIKWKWDIDVHNIKTDLKKIALGLIEGRTYGM